jgi:hypothetical protein
MTKTQDRIAELRAKASECRAAARQTNDEATARDRFKLAAQLEKQARELSKKTKTAWLVR